tara:strand:+ start:1563 stop:1805 length:243 start_codon:yes stop_codon:yes gene_type:complete
MKPFVYKKIPTKNSSAGTIDPSIHSTQIWWNEISPNVGSNNAFGGSRKVRNAFENDLKEHLNYRKPVGITQSDRKVRNHY